MKTIKQIEKAVNIEVQKALEQGFFLVKDQHAFVGSTGGVCLVGAICAARGARTHLHVTRDRAARILGVPTDDIFLMENGFEYGPSGGMSHDAALKRLGARIAQEYNAGD